MKELAQRQPDTGEIQDLAGGNHKGVTRQPVIVADSSAVVEVSLNTPSGLEIRRRFAVEEEIDVPHLLDLEVLQVLTALRQNFGLGRPTHGGGASGL